MIRHALAVVTVLIVFSLPADAQTPTSPVNGAALYRNRCASCHGESGRGNGEYAGLLNPKPRDFTSGRFKLRSTETGGLPTDEDLAHSITEGLNGS